MRRLILIVLACCATQAKANDVWLDGNGLYAKCTSRLPADQLVCGYYVMGVIDSTVMDDDGIETPKGATMAQVSDMIVKAMKEQPDKRHYPAAIIVHAVLKAAWPRAPR